MHFRRSLLITALSTAAQCGAQWPVINEVLPSNGDRIEIFLPKGPPIDLCGYRLVLNGRVHCITDKVILGTGSFATIDLHHVAGAMGSDSATLRLPCSGGTLLLIAADGATVVDVFTWKDLVHGRSVGRAPDGSGSARVLADPSIGYSNQDGPADPVFLVGDDATLHLAADSTDLWGAEQGIDTEGASANYSRRGKAWTRNASITLEEGARVSARLRVAGSGSRSLAKRSFHVRMTGARVALGEDTCTAVTLRADASPNAFLRNTFITAIARNAGANVDLQPDRPAQLELNGRPWGLYRVMPKKNKEWVRSLAHGRSVDLLDGPQRTVISGNGDNFRSALALLRQQAPVDTLEAWFDLNSLIDLACLDIYTGRADHDLNVRCWRSHAAGGRWRWILYDMDLWAPAEENSVERMLAGSPDDTPFLPLLFDHADLRERLLRRASALLSTLLSPERAVAIADSIYQVNADLLFADHQRWCEELPMPSPTEGIAEMRAFIKQRPEHLLAFLARAAGRTVGSCRIVVEPARSGSITLEGLALTDSVATMAGFDALPMRVEAKPAVGFEFVGWEGMDSIDPEVLIEPVGAGEVRALFRPAAWSRGHGLQQAGE